MRLSIWSPRAAPRDGLCLILPHLAERTKLVWVCEGRAPEGAPRVSSPDSPPDTDLNLYDVADATEHSFAFRAARERPGVVLLRDWSLRDLLALEMAQQETRARALREMQRAHGDDGAFVARLVARDLGGAFLPALFPLNDRLLEGSLGVVTLTDETRRRVAQRLGEERVLRLPMHLASTRTAGPSRVEARRLLGIPDDSLVVATAMTDPIRLPALIRVIAHLRGEFEGLRLIVGTGRAELAAGHTSVHDLDVMAAAADVVVALDGPNPGSVPAGLSEALAAQRALVLTSGSTTTIDLPEGAVAVVEPGRNEEEELLAIVGHLLRHEGLRTQLGRLAAEEARRLAEPESLASALLVFLQRLESGRSRILAGVAAARAREDTLLGFLAGEIEGGARSLGIHAPDLGLEPLLTSLLRAAR
jgi:hypothetical protein